jgi:hypothetical protein
MSCRGLADSEWGRHGSAMGVTVQRIYFYGHSKRGQEHILAYQSVTNTVITTVTQD